MATLVTPQQYEDCEACYKISCKNCPWEATPNETLKIQKRELTNCPDCGWEPKN